MEIEFKNVAELFQKLKPAFLVKLRMLQSEKMTYIMAEDIWNFLKTEKWQKTNNLSISEMVQDIIHCENSEIDNYLRNKLYNKERYLYFKDSITR